VSDVTRTFRALPTMLAVGFSSSVAYRAEFLVWMLATNMPIIMLLLWSAVAQEAPLGRMGPSQLGAYFLAVLVVRLLTSCWVVWEMNWEVRRGYLGMRLLKPMHPFLSYAADHVAAIPLRALMSVPIAAGALWWLGAAQLSGDVVHWVVWPLTVVGAWLIIFGVGLVVGTLSLWWESSLALNDLWLALFFVFSGYTIPLELFPGWLLDVVRWLPFRFALAFPVEVMLGLVDRRGLLEGLAAQWGYAGLAMGLALGLWRQGLRRHAFYGG
jgi:ABC-2 type transport system permease protein